MSITSLFNIKYPIVQGGMIWCSGHKLASAVSNNGGLGLIGAGSMHPETFEEHIIKCKAETQNPFGVNVPLLYPEMDRIIDVIIKQEVKIVFTSAGNPALWTAKLKKHGIKVVHVVSNLKFALKAQEAGVDAIVAEGFEAGGHNGKEETTTMCLIPPIVNAVKVPVIAAGGIGSGSAMLAALSLGAQGVQIGSLFAATEESSAHLNFKQMIINAKEGDTQLTLKKHVPVRLLKNEFYQQVKALEDEGGTPEDFAELLGKGRAKKGMLEGDIANGELEIGQVSSQIKEIKPVEQVMQELITGYNRALTRIQLLDHYR